MKPSQPVVVKNDITKFFSSKAYAVVGVSRDKKKFGSTVFRAMNSRFFTVYPVNPHLSTFDDVQCVATVRDLPDEVQSVVIVVHPEDARHILTECKHKGIENIWLQPGAESDDAIEFAKHNGMNVIHHQCILMFLEPVELFHALHRWVNKRTGAYPH